MKKLLFIAAVLMLTTGTYAQRFALGLKGGVNSTEFNLTDLPDNYDDASDKASGYLFGAYGKVKIINNLSIQPELYYSKKNTKMRNLDNDVIEGSIRSWDLPILVNLNLLDFKIGNIYGLAGPVASFTTKADEDFYIDENKTNWTFQAGLGAEIWRINADFRYEWGLTDISDIPNLDIGQRTNVFTFTLGFRLLGI